MAEQSASPDASGQDNPGEEEEMALDSPEEMEVKTPATAPQKRPAEIYYALPSSTDSTSEEEVEGDEFKVKKSRKTRRKAAKKQKQEIEAKEAEKEEVKEKATPKEDKKQPEQKPATPAKPALPKIYVYETDFIKCARDVKATCQVSAPEISFRVNHLVLKIEELRDWNAVVSGLRNGKVQHYTFTPKNERPVKTVLKYLPPQYSEDEIKEELTSCY